MSTLIGTEVLKLRTIRSPWLLLLGAQLGVLVGVSGFLLNGNLRNPDAPAGAAAHVGLLSLLPLALGILAVAGEYRHKTITDSYLSTPRRERVLLSKLGVYTLSGFGFGLVDSITALAAIATWFAAKGVPLHWDNGALWRTVAGGIFWNAAFAAIGVGIGALIRNLPGALATALAWIAVVEGLVGQLLTSVQRWLPFAAGSALGHTKMGLSNLAQLPAGLVLTGYAVLLTAVAVLTTVRRDVA